MVLSDPTPSSACCSVTSSPSAAAAGSASSDGWANATVIVALVVALVSALVSVTGIVLAHRFTVKREKDKAERDEEQDKQRWAHELQRDKVRWKAERDEREALWRRERVDRLHESRIVAYSALLEHSKKVNVAAQAGFRYLDEIDLFGQVETERAKLHSDLVEATGRLDSAAATVELILSGKVRDTIGRAIRLFPSLRVVLNAPVPQGNVEIPMGVGKPYMPLQDFQMEFRQAMKQIVVDMRLEVGSELVDDVDNQT